MVARRRVESPYVTAGQAAKILGVHRTRIYQLANAGALTIAGVSVDGVQVFSREHIESYADRRKASAGGALETLRSGRVGDADRDPVGEGAGASRAR